MVRREKTALARAASVILFCVLCMSNPHTLTAQESLLAPAKTGFEVMVAPLIESKRYGASTMVQLKDGRILLAYNDWTMMGENLDFSPAFVAGRFSRDGGRSWGRQFVLQENTSELGRMGPTTLLRLQNGNIGFVHSEVMSPADYRYYFRTSSDETQSWSAPVRINQDAQCYSMNNHRVIQLRSGRLLAPFSVVPDKRGDYTWESMCYYSDDNGRTWHMGKGRVKLPKYRTGAQEPGLVELKDGSVLMIVRNQQERIYRAISQNGGNTWSDPEPMAALIAPVSPATIMRIPSTGDLLMVWNYSPKVRTPLATAISKDEGQTWGNIKYLESSYFSYAYTSFLFLPNSNELLLSYWIDHTYSRPNPGIGIKVRGIPVDWLYSN